MLSGAFRGGYTTHIHTRKCYKVKKNFSYIANHPSHRTIRRSGKQRKLEKSTEASIFDRECEREREGERAKEINIKIRKQKSDLCTQPQHTVEHLVSVWHKKWEQNVI